MEAITCIQFEFSLIYYQVKLMKQVKEEADRNKQSEARRNKEVAQLKRDQIQKENRIRNLEKEKKQKETVLKRKVEEVLRLNCQCYLYL